MFIPTKQLNWQSIDNKFSGYALLSFRHKMIYTGSIIELSKAHRYLNRTYRLVRLSTSLNYTINRRVN